MGVTIVHGCSREEDAMNYYDNILVYLWLVPIIGLIVIPVLWTLFATVYRFLERRRLVQVEGCVLPGAAKLAGAGNEEKRNCERILLNEGHAYIDEADDCCKAAVCNISRYGICLDHIPRAVDVKDDPMMVLFRTPERDFTFSAKPMWKKLTDNGYIVGAAIDHAPSGWENLLERFDQPCTAPNASMQEV